MEVGYWVYRREEGNQADCTLPGSGRSWRDIRFGQPKEQHSGECDVRSDWGQGADGATLLSVLQKTKLSSVWQEYTGVLLRCPLGVSCI